MVTVNKRAPLEENRRFIHALLDRWRPGPNGSLSGPRKLGRVPDAATGIHGPDRTRLWSRRCPAGAGLFCSYRADYR